jgi:hypothetical protein
MPAVRAATTAFFVLLAAPSFATEWTHCNDAEGSASVDFLTGDGLPVVSVVGLTITVGEKVWASDVAYGPGDPVSVGQAYEDAETIRIDAVDPEVSTRIAEVRLFKASEGDSVAYGGTLRIPGQGAWAVSCDAGAE